MSRFADRLLKACSNPVLLKRYLFNKFDETIYFKEFVTAKYIRSEADDGLYIRAVEKANHDFRAFGKFKRNRHYRRILEHLSYEQGLEYFELLRNEAPDLLQDIDRFLVNDIVGGPIRYRYNSIGLASPTTLRYLKVASDLRQLFGDLNGLTVGEVGVGYGGQLLVLDQIYTFKRYDLYDLPPVLQLASKYLESHLLNSSFRITTLNQQSNDISYDLVISNYAFSELPPKLAAKYAQKVFSNARRGYLTMNTGRGCKTRNAGRLTLEEYHNLLPPFEIKDERPLTEAHNYILIWGHGKTIADYRSPSSHVGLPPKFDPDGR